MINEHGMQIGVTIQAERPDQPEALALIDELEAYLTPLYPDESRHGYSVEKLIAQGVAFFVLRTDGEAAGCGGVQFYDGEYAELKRMYVRPRFRGLGLAKGMLMHLEEFSRSNGLTLVRLETGIYQKEAVGLYERMGYHSIPPFGVYRPDPLSLFYEKNLG
jgi:GNAT superfamily N-acetyltransferase